MRHYIQADDGLELVVEHADRLTFSSGSLRDAYQWIRRAVDPVAIVPSVLRALSTEIDEITHADLRELQAVIDVDTTNASREETVAATVEQAVATVGRWQQSKPARRPRGRP